MNSQADDPNVGGVGTDAINQRILKLYPDQENPLQATAMVKYWYVLLSDNRGSIDFPHNWQV